MPPGLIVSSGDGAALLDLIVNVGSQSLFVSFLHGGSIGHVER